MNINEELHIAMDEYFKVRPQIDNSDRRKVFESGFLAAMTLLSRQHASAYKIPYVITFEGVKSVHFSRAEGNTSTDAELMAMMEGQIGYEVCVVGDSKVVTDKYGVVHHSIPLIERPKL